MDSRKKQIIFALMVAMFLGAIEGTVVTTAVPTIVRELSGFSMISLVFSVYLLTSAISTPVYGKLADLFGRKHVLMAGIGIFLTGSLLCALSWNMTMLILFRALQGLGAGSIFTIAYTIVGDVFTLEERPRVQGSIGTVWGIASLAGPFLGGFLIDFLSWHWIFLINLPFGLLSVFLLQRNLTEQLVKRKPQFDVAGTLTLSAAMLVFMNLFLGNSAGLSQGVFTAVSLVVTAMLLAGFILAERRAAEAVMPLSLFTRTSTLVNMISLMLSAVLIGADVYLPVYLQNVLGQHATVSGLVMAPMSLAWLMFSVILGRRISKKGTRWVLIVSGTLSAVGALTLLALKQDSSLVFAMLSSFVLGAGFGGAFTTLTIVIQSAVSFEQRGAATATNALLRTLGQTMGVSIFGALFNRSVIRYFDLRGIHNIVPDRLFSEEAQGAQISVTEAANAVFGSVHSLFYVLIGLTAVCLAITMLLPRNKEIEEDKVAI